MQLTSTTDYAIRMVVYLAIERRVVSSTEISRAMGIPADYLKAVSAPLRMAGIVASRKGAQGGYVLSRAPEDVTLLDIIGLTEGTTRINRCLEHDRYCSRFATETCPVRACYVQLQTIVEYGLRSVTIGRLIDEGLRADASAHDGLIAESSARPIGNENRIRIKESERCD